MTTLSLQHAKMLLWKNCSIPKSVKDILINPQYPTVVLIKNDK